MAAAALAFGLWLASQHPLWPLPVALAWLGLVVAAARWPLAAVGLLGALLPVADQAIHTGSWIADETDLLVLALLAGGCLRRVWVAPAATVRWRAATALWLACTAGVVVSGLVPWLIGSAPPGLDAPVAVWSSSKALVWAGLLLGLWTLQFPARIDAVLRAWTLGCVIGLALVCLAVLWELTLHTGWPLLQLGYRTTGRFWEMRLGGGAIDVYLAATLPMVAWALLTTRRPAAWWSLAVLLCLAIQVLMSTQSRALLVAVLGALLLLAGFWLRHRDLLGWRDGARLRWGGLFVLIGLQLVWVVLTSSALQQRMERSAGDLGARRAHWERGLALLPPGPERWLGLGAGQLPARYGAVPGPGEFAGRLDWTPDAQARLRMRLHGPVSDPRIGHLFAAAQRLADPSPGWHQVRLRAQSATGARLLLSVCERHLIYDRRCQWERMEVPASGQPLSLSVRLRGSPLEPDGLFSSWRPVLFGVSVLTPGAEVQIESIDLLDEQERSRLDNGDFRDGVARWIATAQGRFEPFHLDSLYLEFLVERGLPGLAGLLLVIGLAARGACPALGRGEALATLAAVTLASLCALGLLISVGEMPRLLLLLWLTLGLAGQLRPKTSHKRMM